MPSRERGEAGRQGKSGFASGFGAWDFRAPGPPADRTQSFDLATRVPRRGSPGACPAIEVGISLPGARVVRVRDRLAKTRALPKVIVLDNCPEMRGLALDDWAYRNRVRLAALGPGPHDARGIRLTPSGACPGRDDNKREKARSIINPSSQAE